MPASADVPTHASRPHSAPLLPEPLAVLAEAFVDSLEVGPPVADCCAEQLHEALRGQGRKQSEALVGVLLRQDAQGEGALHRLARKPDSRAHSALDCVVQFLGPHLTPGDFSELVRAQNALGERAAQIAAHRGDSLLAAQLTALEELAPRKPLSPWPWARDSAAQGIGESTAQAKASGAPASSSHQSASGKNRRRVAATA